MLVAKQVADLITLSRGLMAFFLAWLGFWRGETALPLAAWTMIMDWMGDSVDGSLARRSRVYYHTWIGDHDLEIDMLVSTGLLLYLMASGFVSPIQTVIYLLVWAVVFWHWGIAPALGMLYQAPVYGWFIWVALREAPSSGMWLVIFILGMVIVTWPKFPNIIVPGFLAGLQHALRHGADEKDEQEQ